MESNKQLLDRLKVDMQHRGMSEHTQRNYRQHVAKFLDFCGKSAVEINEEDVRGFLLHLLHEGKVCTGTINCYNVAIRLFYAVTINQPINCLQLPRFKRNKTLPVLLSRQKIKRLITGCTNPKHRAYFLIAYGGGLRVSKIATLTVKDIDSKAMRIFIQGG